MQDLRHPRVHLDEQVAGHHQGHQSRAHHSPLVQRGVGLGRPQTSLGDHQVFDYLRHHLLYLGELCRSQGTGHEIGQPEDELALDHVLGHNLVARVEVLVGAHGHAVAKVHVAQQEDALPGHQYVVEEDDGVHLLKAGAQGMVEVGAGQVVGLPAQEPEARSVAGDGEGEGRVLGRVAGQTMGPGGVNRDLIGQWSQGSQHTRTPDHDPRVGLPHHRQGHIRLVFQRRGHGGAVALQVDQCVGQHQVVFPYVFVVLLDILLEFRTVLGEIVSGGGHGHDADVQEIRRAAHHPAGLPRPVSHHSMPMLQVFGGPRREERHTNPFAAGRRHIGHLIP